MTFTNTQQSHAHSRYVIDQLYEYDDFMSSIGTLIDMGCGRGLDLDWWATATTRDENPEPLNIQCVGVDLADDPGIGNRYANLAYQKTDFEQQGIDLIDQSRTYDVVWCHDAFQYAIDPLCTLSQWWNITSDGGMLYIGIPQTTNMRRGQQDFTQVSGCYHHYTMVSLIHQLAVCGWDCRAGFFSKQINDPWIHAVVYKSEIGPQDPRTTTWYQLAEQGLIPESAARSVQAHGYLRQQDLVVAWLDKGLQYMGHQ